MRILHLAPQPFFIERGTPIAVRMLSETLGQLGHEVDLLVYHEGQDVAMEGVRVIRIAPPGWVRGVPAGPSWKKLVCDLWYMARFSSLVRARDYDVIHAVEEAAFMAYLIRGIHGRPYVMDMDSSIPDHLASVYRWSRPFLGAVRFLDRRVIRNAVAVMSMCKSLADQARDSGARGYVDVVEDAAMLGSVPKPGQDPPLRQEFDIEPGVPIVLYVGNLQPYQGIDLLLEAMTRTECREVLVIVGGEPEVVARYRERARKLKVDHRVHWAGPRPLGELSWNLEQADVLVSPRYSGTNTPMKIYSYLASGVPIVATNILSHSQVLSDDVAVLVDPEPDALAAGLDRLVGDEVLRATLGARGQALVKEKYSRQAFDCKVGKFYRHVEQVVAE